MRRVVSSEMSYAVTCRDFVAFLDDYLSGSLPEDRRTAFNSHLSRCPSCVSYMKTYSASIELGRTVLARSQDPVPEDVPEELVRAVLRAAREP
jgi:anti-sigma factor RsiW